MRNYGRLFIRAAVGRLDDAFAALDRAADMHAWPFLVGSLPISEEPWKEPRYAQLARRAGTPGGPASSA